MKIEFDEREKQGMEEQRQNETYEKSLLYPDDIGKEYSICFEITDHIKADCFIRNLLIGVNNEEDLGVKFTSFNFYGNLSEERDKMLNELIEVINKYK